MSQSDTPSCGLHIFGRGKQKKKKKKPLKLSKLFLRQFNLNILICINMLLEIPLHEFFSELIK